MSVPGGGSWQAGQGAGQFTPGQATAMPTSTVELSLQCANLADMDVFSKSDPFCVLYMKVRLLRTSFWRDLIIVHCLESSGGPDRWLCVDKTETIDNTLNPLWEKKFILLYKFEVKQMLRFDVYDRDSESNRLEVLLLNAHPSYSKVNSH